MSYKARGFVYRRVSSIGKRGTLGVFLESADARMRDAVHIVCAEEKVFPDSLEPSPSVLQAEDVGDFDLIGLEALVRMKLTSFWDKDRMHLRDLAGVGLVDSSLVPHLPATLAKRLQAILDNPEG